MRVTFNMRAMQMMNMLERSLSNYTEASKKVDAQRGLLNPWQDTSSYIGAYSTSQMIEELTQFSENASNASNWLNNTDNELKELIEALKKARDDYAIAGATDSYNETSRKALAQDVASIYEQIMDIANANYLGRYIFAGYQTNSAPFESGTNGVSNVTTKNANGEALKGDAIIKNVFSDLQELATGRYRANIVVDNGIAKLELYDPTGKKVTIDSNGSDEAGGNGNRTGTAVTFAYEPGKVINTGRGISFKMPEDLDNPTSIVIDFDYKSGQSTTYNGDSGKILTQVSYNQDIQINTTGDSIFIESSRILEGSRVNTVNGIKATLSSKFSSLDNTNVSIGDSISVNGTDHQGLKVGIASLISPLDPSLDLTTSTEKERSLYLAYSDKIYKIVVPQKSYGSIQELSNAINYELKNAEYIGALGDISGKHASIYDYSVALKGEVMSGKYPGEISQDDKNKYMKDLSSAIRVSFDGDRLMFSSQLAGDNVRIGVVGNDQSVLGFKNQSIAAEGKDTIFEIGYDFHTDSIEPMQTTHSNLSFNNAAEETYTFYINGQDVHIKVPAMQTNNTPLTNVAFGTDDVLLQIAGKDIMVKADYFNAAPDKEQYIRDLLADYALNGEASLNNWVDNGDGTYSFEITTSSPSKKDLEYLFDSAITSAGLGDTVKVRFDGVSTNLADIGSYNVSFYMANYNSSRDNILNTVLYDNNIPMAAPVDMQSAYVERAGVTFAEEKTIGDYVKFLENLYDNNVSVTLNEGKLRIKDLRGGDSNLTFRTSSQNQGVGHSDDTHIKVSGSYSAHRDATWNLTVNTILGANDTRIVSVQVQDIHGNLLYDKRISDYKGETISLRDGINITLDDMNIPRTDGAGNIIRQATSYIQVGLNAEPNLSFGDMNIVSSGQNVNVFQTIKNLQFALENNISKNGFGEPTAWRNLDQASTAKPFIDGSFRGNFNDTWHYEILGEMSATDFYIQNEYSASTGAIRFDQNIIDKIGSTLEFGIEIYNNDSKYQDRINVSLDLEKARPAITTSDELKSFILKELNNMDEFTSQNIRFQEGKNGSITIYSGSGTQIANFVSTASDVATRNLASYILSLPTVANGEMLSTIPLTLAADTSFYITDLGGDETAANYPYTLITVPAGTYDTEADFILAINNELTLDTGTSGRIRASINSNGAIEFKDMYGVDVAAYRDAQDADNLFKLTLALDTANNNKIGNLLASAVQTPKTDMSEMSEAERTLSFRYTEGPTKEVMEFKIVLDKKEYKDTAEIAEHINELLLGAAMPEEQLQAIVNENGTLAFITHNDTMNTLAIEGDYNGTLGFPKAGESVKVKVSNSAGNLVQNMTLNTANRSEFVSDGLYLGFDAGLLYATDSFDVAIGSGIESEIPNLEKAVNQVLSASTIVGTRGQRVDSIVSFQETVISTSEETKAKYQKATSADLLKLSTDLKLSLSAYEAAMSVTSQMLNVSILNFLS